MKLWRVGELDGSFALVWADDAEGARIQADALSACHPSGEPVEIMPPEKPGVLYWYEEGDPWVDHNSWEDYEDDDIPAPE